jgi:hypothetical protein
MKASKPFSTAVIAAPAFISRLPPPCLPDCGTQAGEASSQWPNAFYIQIDSKNILCYKCKYSKSKITFQFPTLWAFL